MLVGRELELQALNAAFVKAQSGAGNIFFITGEAGLGKTTLVHSWRASLPETIMYAEAACSIPIGNIDVGKIESLQPWADVVGQLQSLASQGKKKLDIIKLIHDSAPAWAWAIPFVGDIAHAAVETHRLLREQQGEASRNLYAQSQQQIFQQYVNLLTSVATESPLVILLDDMHWADASSTNLLFYLARQIGDKNILVIVTYRPDEANAANAGKGHPIVKIKNEIFRYLVGTEIGLSYLDRKAISELLSKTFENYNIDDTFERWLLKISDGNSLFVAQFIKTLREDNWLTDYGKFVGQYENINVPPTALAVVEERTRRLDQETCELLRYATAEGEEFTSFVLARLKNKEPLELLRELRRAEHEGIVRSKGSARLYANQTTSIFGFSHALFHQALYSALLPEEREILHRQCFDILHKEWDRVAQAPESAMALASKLLVHAEKSGEIETAAEIALQTAIIAWGNFAEAETLEMIGHVRRLAADPLVSPAHRNRILGDTMILQSSVDSLHGRYDDAERAADESYAFYQAVSDEFKSIKSLIKKADAQRMSGKFDEATVTAVSGMKKASAGHERILEAALFNTLGNITGDRGSLDDSLEYYTQSLEIYESLNDASGTALMLNNIGIVHGLRGEHLRALDFFKRSLHMNEVAGSRYDIARTLNNMGSTNNVLGNYSEALECHKRGLRIRETIGDMYGIASSLMNIGNVYGKRGENIEALKYFTQCKQMWVTEKSPQIMIAVLINIGTAHERLNELKDTFENLQQALDLARKINAKHYEGVILCELGMAYSNEASTLHDEAKHKAIKKAIELLDEGIVQCKALGHGDREVYEDKLAELQNELDSNQ